MKDLVILVPDKDIEATMQNLLIHRCTDLGIRQVSFDIYVHLERDPGVYRNAHEFLRPFCRQYDRALVIFDRWGCGDHKDSDEISLVVRERLTRNGWADRCGVVVINPELEMWLWTRSPAVTVALGWRGDYEGMMAWLQSKGFGLIGGKPDRPKDAFRRILRYTRKPRSPEIFGSLARSVPFDRCKDLSFRRLKHLLVSWFGRI